MIVGLPRVEIEVLINLFLESDLIGDDELLFGYFLVCRNILFGHEVKEEVLRVEFFIEILFDVLIPSVLQIVKQLNSVALEIQP